VSAFASQIGPRDPGVRYLFGYSGRLYTVLAVEEHTHGWWMTVEGQDGSATGHCTPWDADRDRVIR
jgi:hypothetical protein